MDFHHSVKSAALQERLQAFMDEHIHSHESVYKKEQAPLTDRWLPVPIVEHLKPLAKAAGLWNLFLPASARARG
jgi:acyl-CoA dehydrogenase